MTYAAVAFLAAAMIFVGISATGAMAAGANGEMLWIDSAPAKPDTYVAFRGRFELAADGEIELRTLGASWYVVWLDGGYVEEGPARFEVKHPQYLSRRLKLAAGKHVLAVQLHHIGAETRILLDMPPFLYCKVVLGETEVPVAWKCTLLPGYRPGVRRINPQLGWIEWCDTQQNPADWQLPGFDDAGWTQPAQAKTKLGGIEPVTLAPLRYLTHPARQIAQGRLAEVFGYELDDIPARFTMRDLVCDKLPPQGVWFRYDLGRVRLARPRFVMDLPKGAVVEFAYSESLMNGRVAPYITLSTGTSCNLDHYVARGGPQEFFPLTPKGGRFVEMHIFADAGKVKLIKQEFVERMYHGEAEGAFSCGDTLLDRIWLTGVETYRACTEDALVDNPTRERGQWTGDVVSAGMDISSVAYADLRLCRRGLVQSAQCAREDGLVAGLCPGGPTFPATYAAQWIDACVHYHELTGDKAILEEMLPYAKRNLAAFETFVTKDGLADGTGWVFVDWGYVRNPGPADIAYNMHFLSALRAFSRWCGLIDKADEAKKCDETAASIQAMIQRWLDGHIAKGPEGWQAIGYHSAVLGLRLGLIAREHEPACIAYVKRHILDCFPNNPEAPRLSAPDANNRRLITPYFAHYAFPTLIEHDEMDFVLDQYRKCWGWALDDDRTTWVEVFDTRWTHCHQWAGCPTWQLSRYVLGLHPRFDLGRNHYVLRLAAGSLPSAKGALPLPDGQGLIRIEWQRQAAGIQYRLTCDKPIWVHVGGPQGKVETVKAQYDARLP